MKFVNIFLLFSLDSRKKSKYNREAQGALPLDPAKGSSTLWTPFFAIELVATAYSMRVFMGERGWCCPLTLSREWVERALMLCPRVSPKNRYSLPSAQKLPQQEEFPR